MSESLFAIYGASGCGRGIMPLAREQLHLTKDNEKLVFVDDDPTLSYVNGHQVMKFSEFTSYPIPNKYVSLAIANSYIRKDLANRCIENNINFFSLRASNVITMDEVVIGQGSILCPFVTLTSNIKIGVHFHANLYSYVEHDCVIGNFVTFAPSVKCNGNVIIEDHAYIGSGAMIKQGTPENPLIIGQGAIIGMGSVVTKSVPPNVTVMGNPAKIAYKNTALSK